MAKAFYHVAPRYTAGSPAMVDRATAERVIRQEQDGYQCALEGVCGAAERVLAETRGMAGIVWTTHENRSTLVTNDLITGETTSQRIKRDGSLSPA